MRKRRVMATTAALMTTTSVTLLQDVLMHCRVYDAARDHHRHTTYIPVGLMGIPWEYYCSSVGMGKSMGMASIRCEFSGSLFYDAHEKQQQVQWESWDTTGSGREREWPMGMGIKPGWAWEQEWEWEWTIGTGESEIEKDIPSHLYSPPPADQLWPSTWFLYRWPAKLMQNSELPLNDRFVDLPTSSCSTTFASSLHSQSSIEGIFDLIDWFTMHRRCAIMTRLRLKCSGWSESVSLQRREERKEWN